MLNTVLTDPLAQAGDEPDVHALQEEYQRAWTQIFQDVDGITRIARAEDIRFTRWSGQCSDGLKHQDRLPEGVEARPYDKAPDCRIPLADETVNAIVDILYAAFFGARVNPKPVHASKMTAHEAGEWRAVISWMLHGPLAESLINNVEFLAQVANTVGWCALHPTWVKREAMQPQELHLDEIKAAAQQAPQGSALAGAVDIILDPETEDAAVELMQSLYESVDKATARKCVQDLRGPEQCCYFDAPVVVQNGPELMVLVPWIDIVYPVEMTDPQRSRAWFHRIYLSEAEVESMGREEDWDAEFIAAVKQTAGMVSDLTQTEDTERDSNNRQIEIIISYVRQVKDGVTGIYCTVFSPNIYVKGMAPQKTTGHGEARGRKVFSDGQLYAKHFLLDFGHGQYPFLIYQTEVVGKRPSDARGAPEIFATQQTEIKRQRDALFVHTELSVTPPLKKIGTKASKLPPEFGPLAVFNFGANNDWDWFAPPPGKPEIAFKLIEDIKKERDEYFGFMRPDTHPSRAQARQQRMVNRWLMTFGRALWQLSVLAYENLTEEELTELLGRKPMLTADKLLKHHLTLWFDVRSLDNEWVSQMIEQIGKILAVDTGGTIDRSKLTGILAAYLDPTLAEEVSVDQQGAAQAVFHQVRDEVAQVMLGNEAQYTENDPTAKMKMQFLKQIVTNNPDYMSQLHPQSPQHNPRKAELLQRYQKNLAQSAVQQDNKTVGRLGVQPGAPAGNGK